MDCGFPNLTSFYKSFRQHFGTSPAKYRSEMQYLAYQRNMAIEKGRISLKKYLKFHVSNAPEDEYTPVICSVKTSAAKYTKCWNKVVNIGEISNLARSDFQKHVLFLKEKLGFSYVRIWNINAPDLQIIKHQNGQQTFDFSRFDRIVDFIVENGLSVYLDLG